MLCNIFRIMVWVKRAFIIKSFLIHKGFSIHQLSFYTQAVLYITYSIIILFFPVKYPVMRGKVTAWHDPRPEKNCVLMVSDKMHL